PIVLLASIMRSAIGDKLEVAGALRGEPIELVPGETVSLEVPAGAEAILEGRILPHVREEEGPFGEVSQYYFSDVSHVVEITAITHRQQPVIQALHPTAREVSVLAGIPAEFEILRLLRAQGFAVEAVRISGGTSYPHAVFSIRQTKTGQARQALFVLLSSMGFIKHAVAVDEDVDLDDPRDVEWALATRVQADEDLVVLTGLVGSSVDPSAEARGVTAKVGVDATKPFRERERFERIGVPAEVRERARAVAARYLDRR
ncbi:MAG: UbiD family decarboxylase, partial [Deltaproteobacteria bacterium]|nr:UbiD family decarboxylase [Deltaproteobacteria bacterium]